MSIYQILMDELDGQKFDRLAEYDAEIERHIHILEDELGKAERWVMSHDREVLDQLNVEIKELDEDEEGAD